MGSLLLSWQLRLKRDTVISQSGLHERKRLTQGTFVLHDLQHRCSFAVRPTAHDAAKDTCRKRSDLVRRTITTPPHHHIEQ
jgi:hypothetical protein